MNQKSKGVFALVVGPSGVGKDTLIQGAKVRLGRDDRFAFPKRHITRPQNAGGENHIEVSEAEYADMQSAKCYALSWDAHGLSYGIPVSALGHLNLGRTLVVNVSRSILDEARARFPNVCIFSVTAPEDVLRARLLSRGRESADSVEKRIARARQQSVPGDDVIEISNDGDMRSGIERFVTALQSVSNAK